MYGKPFCWNAVGGKSKYMEENHKVAFGFPYKILCTVKKSLFHLTLKQN